MLQDYKEKKSLLYTHCLYLGLKGHCLPGDRVKPYNRTSFSRRYIALCYFCHYLMIPILPKDLLSVYTSVHDGIQTRREEREN